jgi:uncharacterized membrane protein
VASEPRHLGAFGDDPFGRTAERAARFFGTPQYIIGQTLIVIAWIAVNAVAAAARWDPYPFILLNLAFSTQAAYAAPLILLAQTRQAERDKNHGDRIEQRHTELEQSAVERAEQLQRLLQANTALTQQDRDLTEQVHALTQEIRNLLAPRPPS